MITYIILLIIGIAVGMMIANEAHKWALRAENALIIKKPRALQFWNDAVELGIGDDVGNSYREFEKCWNQLYDKRS